MSASRHQLQAARADPEDEQQHNYRKDADQQDAIELKRSAYEQHPGREEIVDRGTLKPAVGDFTYDEGEKVCKS